MFITTLILVERVPGADWLLALAAFGFSMSSTPVTRLKGYHWSVPIHNQPCALCYAFLRIKKRIEASCHVAFNADER